MVDVEWRVWRQDGSPDGAREIQAPDARSAAETWAACEDQYSNCYEIAGGGLPVRLEVVRADRPETSRWLIEVWGRISSTYNSCLIGGRIESTQSSGKAGGT